jgi:hypothetical protein
MDKNSYSNYFRYSDAPHITDTLVLIVTCLSLVNFLMSTQIWSMSEDISADVTLVLFGSNMSQLMLPEGAQALEPHLTTRPLALILSFPLVPARVSPQLRCQFVRLPAARLAAGSGTA